MCYSYKTYERIEINEKIQFINKVHLEIFQSFFICSFLKTCRWVFSAFGCDHWNGTFARLLPFFLLIQLVIAFAWAFVRNFQNSFPFIKSFVLCFVWPCSFVFHLVWTFLLWQENRRTISWKFHHHRLWSIDSLGWI